MATQLKKIAVAEDKDCFSPALKKVAGSTVPSIGHLDEHTVEVTHPPGKIPVRGLNQRVMEARHRAVRITYPVKPVYGLRQHADEPLEVGVILTKPLAPVSPRRYVIQRSGRCSRAGWPVI
ncbi:MAG: hypothetical protein ACPGUC_11000 [Gammaproteobacteria bacterium]